MANTTSTTSFRADISQLKSAMQQAARQVKLANAEFKAATAGMDDWSQSATGLRAKLTQLDSTLSAQKKQLALYEKELELTTKEYGENSAAADRVRIALNNQKVAIAKTEKQIDEYSDELKDAEKYGDNFGDTMEEMNDAAEKASDGFTVMKGALANLVADGIRKAISGFKELAKETISVGANFEASMSKVGAISGASAEDLQALTDKAKEMGETTVFSASESADAFQYMAMAGWDTEDMLDGIAGIMNLAAASGEDLATTSDIVTDALTAMGYSAGDAGKLADVMAAASSNANTNVGLMGQTFQYAAPIIGALGYSMEDAAVAIGLMANAGIKGQKSGTALRSILTRLSAPPKECADAMNELGISLTTVNEDGTESMKSLDEVMQELRKSFDGLSETQQTQYAKSIAGQEAMSGLLAIVNAGAGDYNKLTDAVNESTGAAEKMAQTMNDNVSGQMTLLKSKIEGIQIQVYDQLKPALRDAVSSLSDSLDRIDWSKVGKWLGDVAKKFVNFAKGVIENFDKIASVATAVGKVLLAAFVAQKIITFGQAVSGLITWFKNLKLATESATLAQQGLNAAQAANVIGLVTAAVVGLTTAFLEFGGGSKEAEEKLDALSASEHRHINEIYAMRDAYKEVKAARDETAASITAEFNNYSALAKELDDLVDANGRVKEGYEDRVNFILTTLNEAIGTEMKLVDGVIENYETEKQTIEELIEAKKAEAFLDANKEAYTEAIKNRGEALQNYIDVQNDFIQKQGELNDLLTEQERLNGLTLKEYAAEIGASDDLSLAQEKLTETKKSLGKEITATKIAIGQLHQATDAAESSFVDYNRTIENYEGLSSAIISGDAQKISEALDNMEHDFISAETGTEQSLENQVDTYKAQYEEMKKAVANGSAVVTQEMVDDMKQMVDKSVKELDKFHSQAEQSGKTGMEKYVSGMESITGEATLQAQIIRYETAKTLGADVSEFEKAGKDAGQGYINGMLIVKPDAILEARNLGSDAVGALNEGQDSHSPSAMTTTSGENFGQGFINGMNNKGSTVWNTAYALARRAINALRQGQKEGSPSKLTYQSGVYFVQGYVNGIAKQEKTLQKTVSNLVTGMFDTLRKTEAFNFETTANGLSESFAKKISGDFNYMINKMTYQNEQKLAEYDKEIDRLTAEQDRALAKIDSNDEAGIKKITSKYEALIDVQRKYQEAYSTASQGFIEEFRDAVNEYQQTATDLINSTVSGLADKYNKQYDALISKQESLVGKLKTAGSLFNISGAGIMTVNDLTEQTRQITEYTQKLQEIKNKVSAELFDEIAQFDMREGSAYIDRLLDMSAKDLNAYNKAYTEKLKAAERAGETIYKSDFATVSANYKNEINKAFSEMPKQLEDLGTQAMKGFVSGFTKNTDYLDSNVKLFVKSMVDTFKKELQIKSPSRLMATIGDYTGAGFIQGLKDTIGKVKDTASDMVQAAASPLEDVKTSIGGVRGIIPTGGGATAVNNNTVNNYNLVQNNTSPKSLSALETYQARRQQIALVKAFAQ